MAQKDYIWVELRDCWIKVELKIFNQNVKLYRIRGYNSRKIKLLLGLIDK